MDETQDDKPQRDFADVKYGPHERNVLDLWQARGDAPRPLAIFIHGGGWVNGSKDNLDTSTLEHLLAAGVSVAAINYRYSTTAPFPAPMLDAARALQFLRSKAGEWNLDPDRVACFGGSAGAVISLWLAFHADLADPTTDDPVLRQSTRLTCVGAQNVPTSFDARDTMEWLGGDLASHPAALPFYGVTTRAELNRPEILKLMEEASVINHLTPDAPPVFMQYRQPNVPLSADYTPGELVHHPQYGVKLKEKLDALGIEAVLRYPGRQEGPYRDMADFLAQKLNC